MHALDVCRPGESIWRPSICDGFFVSVMLSGYGMIQGSGQAVQRRAEGYGIPYGLLKDSAVLTSPGAIAPDEPKNETPIGVVAV